MGDIVAELGGIGGLSAASLLGVVVWLILTGRLVPRLVHQEVRDDRDRWKQTAEAKDATIATQAASINELLEVGQTAAHVLRSLPTREDS